MSIKTSHVAAGCGCLMFAPLIGGALVVALFVIVSPPQAFHVAPRAADVSPASADVSPQAADVAELWPHNVGNVDRIPGTKYAADITVGVVDGRVPDAFQLEAIAANLRDANPRHAAYSFAFYLPGMELHAGAFATCHTRDGDAVEFPFAGMPARVTGFPQIYDPIFQTPVGQEFPAILQDGRPWSAKPDEI